MYPVLDSMPPLKQADLPCTVGRTVLEIPRLKSRTKLDKKGVGNVDQKQSHVMARDRERNRKDLCPVIT